MFYVQIELLMNLTSQWWDYISTYIPFYFLIYFISESHNIINDYLSFYFLTYLFDEYNTHHVISCFINSFELLIILKYYINNDPSIINCFWVGFYFISMYSDIDITTFINLYMHSYQTCLFIWRITNYWFYCFTNYELFDVLLLLRSDFISNNESNWRSMIYKSISQDYINDTLVFRSIMYTNLFSDFTVDILFWRLNIYQTVFYDLSDFINLIYLVDQFVEYIFRASINCLFEFPAYMVFNYRGDVLYLIMQLYQYLVGEPTDYFPIWFDIIFTDIVYLLTSDFFFDEYRFTKYDLTTLPFIIAQAEYALYTTM